MVSIPETLGAGISTAYGGFAVTPSDSTVISTRAVYVGGGGDLAVVMASGETVTLASVPSGALLPLRVQKVMSTNTTATDIVGLT